MTPLQLSNRKLVNGVHETLSVLDRSVALGCAVAILLGVALAQPLSASEYGDGGATIRPDPVTLGIAPGQVTAINVVLENAADVYGIDVRARFDPALVEVVDADPAQDGIQMTPGSFLKPDFVVRNTADNGVGTLQYVVTQVNPTQPATGSGVVLTLECARQNIRARASLRSTPSKWPTAGVSRSQCSRRTGSFAWVSRRPPPRKRRPKQTASVEPTVAASASYAGWVHATIADSRGAAALRPVHCHRCAARRRSAWFCRRGSSAGSACVAVGVTRRLLPPARPNGARTGDMTLEG